LHWKESISQGFSNFFPKLLPNPLRGFRGTIPQGCLRDAPARLFAGFFPKLPPNPSCGFRGTLPQGCSRAFFLKIPLKLSAYIGKNPYRKAFPENFYEADNYFFKLRDYFSQSY
jgi:hypothetical protein